MILQSLYMTELNKIYLRTGVTVAILLLFVLLITFSPKYLFLIVTSLTVNMAIAVIFYYVFRTGNAVIFFGGYHGFTEPGD